MKERLGCRYYLRYMDDFVIFHNDSKFLSNVLEEIKKYLMGLRLSVHENKCKVFKTSDGVPFLGLVIFPEKRRLKRENVVRFKRKMKWFQKLHGDGRLPWHRIHQSIQSWIGHASHANTMQLRRLVFEEIIFREERED